ncbi:MAG: GNAT family N-acetyltransferase [Anaerolineaceae bacterium]|nr:GNAT family N-acetyltransferase [Anaerolineaceae bacterium]
MARENQHYKVRKNSPDDLDRLRAFFNSPIHLHQHLDWHSIDERLQSSTFWMAERNKSLSAVLSIPVSTVDVSWVELFGAKKMVSLARSWQELFSGFIEETKQFKPDLRIFSLSYYPWYQKLLESSDFYQAYAIVTLETDAVYLPNVRPLPSNLNMQYISMQNFDLVHQLDTIAFDLPWQMPESALRKAFRNSLYATIILEKKRVVAYQITTEGENTLHLARIAVHPDYRNFGIGGFLIHDLLSYMKRFNFRSLSVNTQSNNEASLALYRKMGFYKTGNNIPVMVYNI